MTEADGPAAMGDALRLARPDSVKMFGMRVVKPVNVLCVGWRRNTVTNALCPHYRSSLTSGDELPGKHRTPNMRRGESNIPLHNCGNVSFWNVDWENGQTYGSIMISIMISD